MHLSSDSTPSAARVQQPVWSPLRQPVFRLLWGTWLTANICMWMNDVAAAWLMTSLSSTPVMVALVQAASTLPVFLLGVPSGALADIVDRRRYFIVTQFWVAAVAVALCLTTFLGVQSAPLLLVLTFANGIGLAMRWPVFAALVPTLVPRPELPGALALNAVAMNLSRIIGPIVAGAVIAAGGSGHVFLLNAVLSICVGLLLLTWRYEQKISVLPSERFFGAIWVGLQYVRQSPEIHAVLWRVFTFFTLSIALLALLPLIAKGFPGGDAGTFTLLLAAMGGGAVVAAFMLPRLRQIMTRDTLVAYGTLLHAATTLIVALAPHPWLATLALPVAGMAWISVANSLTVSVQAALPDWVRARGMSIHQMTMMGGSALGAALWGQVATFADVRQALVLAAAAAVVGLLATRRFKLGGLTGEDKTPVRLWQAPEVAIPIEPEQGPVLITVEYRIDPARAVEFAELMRETRRARLRNGALSWELFHDTSEPGVYIEHFTDSSWVEYMRRNQRATAADIALRERRHALHLGEEPPRIRRYIAEPMARG
ncbi:MFS transporter [Pseudogulbenkiania sp. MAI-1]|uniref:MFS transporter n=1 Tax=Pseudogulbenkiania sp. MAI-1 TaxID=990370 RepID=UPI00045E9F70|nr:MFS transporter [Pseudogulbenkiania sp. MAI-1]